jgi:hypothetical protein
MSARRPTLPEPVKISEWWKNRGGESLRVELSTFEGTNVVSLRTWFIGKDGKMKPGNGVACHVAHLPKLAKVFAQALERAIALGLVDEDGAR